jgi:hypothetical protein
MKRREFIVYGGGTAIGASLAAQAYTTATVSREMDISVVADDSTDALIQFTPGPAEGSRINSNDQLIIDGAATGSDSNDKNVTPDGSFTFGDPSNPSSKYSFSVTNQLNKDRSLTFKTNTAVSTGDVTLEFFASDGTSKGTLSLSNGSGSVSFDLTSGSTTYVVVTIDTTGATSDDTISGTFKTESGPTP